ncbi:hypothetical protein C1X64_05765 [Pseudomonas sp. GW456-E7]|nr:hypothetical protein C1X64_05765 [Pseudomonas sp. GW456-E7]
MVVNDDAGYLIKRGVLKSIASKLAPTIVAHCYGRLSFEQLVAHDARFCRFWCFWRASATAISDWPKPFTQDCRDDRAPPQL